MGQGYGGSYETGGALGDIVDLTTEVIGTLPVANGGTGATTFTDNRVLTGTGTSAITDEPNMLFTGTLLTLLDTTQVVIGHTAAVTTGASNTFQVLGTAAADSSSLVARFSADAVGPSWDFLKSRNASLAGNTIVQNSDVLGRLAFYPADGTNFATLAGVFQCEVDDSSPAVGDVGVAFVWRGMRGAASVIADVMRLSSGGGVVANPSLSPGVNDGTALGTTALMWSDLFLASGAVVNWNNGDVTLTHSANLLAFAGASSGYTFDALVGPATNDAAALGTATVSWADLFLASGGVINWVNGDVTITHSTNTLAFGGASSGYTFDAVITPAASDGAALGTATVMWSDIFLASGAVVNFNNGDVTLTHSANLLAFAGASSGYTFDALVGPATNDAAALGTATVSWADLFLASGGVINWVNGDVTITHSADLLTVAGGDMRLNGILSLNTTAAAFATAESASIAILRASGSTITRPMLVLQSQNTGSVDGDSFITFGTQAANWSAGVDQADSSVFRIENATTLGGTTGLRITSSVLSPGGNDASALGTTALMWSDLFLASGAVVNFNNGNITETHGTNTLTWRGTSAVYSFSSDVARPFILTSTAASGTALIQFSPNAVAKFSVGYNKPGTSDCFIIYDDVASAYRVLLDGSGNLSLGSATTFGASAAGVFQVGNGTAPTTAIADTVAFYSSDNAAGNTIPSFFCEGTDVLATGQADSASSVRVKMRINGTVVTLLAI